LGENTVAQHHCRRYAGFTLIELLVVIAIIGVLVSLLLPAVQKVREAANRSQCQNNLKQLGLALLNYHDGNNCFPPGALTITGTSHGNIAHSWITNILPYIEQQNLHRRYDFSHHWANRSASETSPNETEGVIGTRIPILRCPSAPSKRGESTRSMTDYSGINIHYDSHLGLLPGYRDLHQYNNGGVLLQVSIHATGGDSTGNRVSDILDGSSNTIMVAEDAGRNQVWVMGELSHSSSVHGGSWGGPWANPGNEIQVKGYNPVTRTRGDELMPPCAINCLNGDEIYAFHPGGANVTMADGSVHFLRASTDITVLRALVTVRGSENITPDF
jgi:prepilin-type N-terminal cleavage/methylation domain-containing protein/prepilin-type processing-associated H-X9-DG protein